MPRLVHCAVLVWLLLPLAAAAADSCMTGQRRLNEGEPCIPETLFNYLYCLSKSGGGRVEIVKKDDSSASKALEVSVGGKGSGVIVKGEGNVGVKQSDANRVAKEVNERIDPTLSSKCKELAQPLTTAPKASEPMSSATPGRVATSTGALGPPTAYEESAASSTPPRIRSLKWANPKVRSADNSEVPVAYCLWESHGATSGCGQPAADAFCRAVQQRRAASYSGEIVADRVQLLYFYGSNVFSYSLQYAPANIAFKALADVTCE